MNPSLQQLLQRPDVWRSRDRRLLASDGSGHATGFSALDRHLYGSGWPRGALTELVLAQSGIGELELLTPLLADIGRQQLLQVWINPPFIPYAPALLQNGIALDSLLIVRSEPRHLLWACEQALRSAACGAVLYWPAAQPSYAELRKLQVAAGTQRAVVFLFRDGNAAAHTSPAALRLQLSAQDTQLSIRILKQRNSNSGQHILLPRHQMLQMQLPRVEQTPAITRSIKANIRKFNLHTAPVLFEQSTALLQ
ncbi:MAG TPA: translesion DNA synthesis-associated protein ImuA [Spongiibacteraceae bacterium]|jgi:hypothetical protein